MVNVHTTSASAGTSHRINSGHVVPMRQLQSVLGERIDIPDHDRLVHLQFRRFAGCPVCNLHLRSIVRAHGELVGSGIREVVVFHSSVADLRPYAAELPFAVVADPEKELYMEFGVEHSRQSLLHPRVWGTIILATAHSLVAVARGTQPMPSLDPPGGRFGLPAEFLIAPTGHVMANKYGTHADDQWSVPELLAIARRTYARPNP